jgi:hypothetical protein
LLPEPPPAIAVAVAAAMAPMAHEAPERGLLHHPMKAFQIPYMRLCFKR